MHAARMVGKQKRRLNARSENELRSIEDGVEIIEIILKYPHSFFHSLSFEFFSDIFWHVRYKRELDSIPQIANCECISPNLARSSSKLLGNAVERSLWRSRSRCFRCQK